MVEGGFRKQLETALGRSIEVIWEAEFQARTGISERAEFRRAFERFTEVVDIADVLSGRIKPVGELMLVASLQRGGVLMQLREFRPTTNSAAAPEQSACKTR